MSDKKEVFNEVVRIARECAVSVKDQKIDLNTRIIEDLNIDSMNLIHVISKIEATYDIRFPDNEWHNIGTVEELVDLIMKLVSKKDLEPERN